MQARNQSYIRDSATMHAMGAGLDIRASGRLGAPTSMVVSNNVFHESYDISTGEPGSASAEKAL